MPRLPRIYVKEAAYFITCRGEHNENIFNDREDYKMFLELMKKYQGQYGIKVFAFCLMPDHLHLLIEIEKQQEEQDQVSARSQNISDFMHDLNNNYTKYFNNRYIRKGHLFMERFKSALIEKESSLLKMTAYLHLNPQRSGVIADSKDYPYSSYQLYLDNNPASEQDLSFMRASIQKALSFLNNKSYAEFVQDMSLEEAQIIHKKLQRGGILGSEDFVKEVKIQIQAYQKELINRQAEAQPKKSYWIFVVTASAALVFVAGLSGAYFYFARRNLPLPQNKGQFAIQALLSSEDLKSTEWELKLIPAAGGKETVDVIGFKGGKVSSAKLNLLVYSISNYSVSVADNSRIDWETMQTSAEGTASWRGEIEEGRMRGILSLRKEGREAQDFSFTSISCRRRE